VQEVSSSSEVNFMNDNKKSSYGDSQLSVQPIKKKNFHLDEKASDGKCIQARL